jgi:hypothetical protein
LDLLQAADETILHLTAECSFVETPAEIPGRIEVRRSQRRSTKFSNSKSEKGSLKEVAA